MTVLAAVSEDAGRAAVTHLFITFVRLRLVAGVGVRRSCCSCHIYTFNRSLSGKVVGMTCSKIITLKLFFTD